MIQSHVLGYPRIGPRRELKRALEGFWQGQISDEQLWAQAQALCEQNWQQQIQAGLDFITVGDFSFYDHILDACQLFSVIPTRFAGLQGLEQYFAMARGISLPDNTIAAQAMTKWFNTNYHYLVPELTAQTSFKLNLQAHLWPQLTWAKALNYPIKVVVPGPLTFLRLARALDDVQALSFVEQLVPVYQSLFVSLAEVGIEWVQLDEPILVTDLPLEWKNAFESVYTRLASKPLKVLVATYFGAIGDNAQLACRLPVEGLHIDLVHGAEQLPVILDKLPNYRVLSLGVVNGRNIWRCDAAQAIAKVEQVRQRRGDGIWVSASSSLLHVPVDLAQEADLPESLVLDLAFAKQKLAEIALIKQAVLQPGSQQQALHAQALHQQHKRASLLIHNAAVSERLQSIQGKTHFRPEPYAQRKAVQQAALQLPLLPTTTIGSLPQTLAIRALRRDFKQGQLSQSAYETQIKQQLAQCIQFQEQVDLDVLVHGEFERNDMVEYFGEQLDGYAFTTYGWVQSYGSRCVKPPIIYGDVARKADMTVEWTSYAQSLTTRPVKGMLTGPVTLLFWSFVREDQPLETTCRQIACALQDEVLALEQQGIQIIQIDEPAIREGLPLRRAQWEGYLNWAIECFRICSSAVKATTQIHTHMCYSDFNDIIESIAKLDADVVTIEASRSQMKLLQAFKQFNYPNDIGPGVYDIHSANVPSVDLIVQNLRSALAYIAPAQLWVNPDCGLKTRAWPETQAALSHMVQAAVQLRAQLS